MLRKQAKKWMLGQRGAMTMVEIVAAASMLAVLLASSVQMMHVLATQQLAATRRAMALQAVQALTEELSNTPWAELTPATANKLTVPDLVNFYLPGAVLAATVADEKEPVESKRLSVELRWQASSGQPVAPLRLTTWVYPDELEQPQEE